MINNTTFLKFKDYAGQIQKEDLFQILGDKNATTWTDLCPATQNILLNAEAEAIEEISSYLRLRYITDEIFAPTTDFDINATYFAKNLVLYTEPAFVTTNTYVLDDRFSYKGYIYKQINPVPTTGSLDPATDASYERITENNSYYYANLPIQEFNYKTTYPKDALVWYQDNIYKSKQKVSGQNPADSQNLEIRYGIPSVQNYIGYFSVPNMLNYNPLPNINVDYWELYNGYVNPNFTGTTYYFTGKLPTDTAYWTKGDNRNPQIKMYLIDIMLYHLCSRINPRNIPELRNIRYDGASPSQIGGAIGWLKSIEKGKVNLNSPEIVPTTGRSIVWGSYHKRSNFF